MNESDKKEIFEKIDNTKNDIIDRCKSVERTGLYVMVFLCMMGSCDNSKIHNVESKVDKIQKIISYTHYNVDNTQTIINSNTTINIKQ